MQHCSLRGCIRPLAKHLGKTECIIFGSKRKLSKAKDFSIIGNGQNVKKGQNSVQYLGVVLDQN